MRARFALAKATRLGVDWFRWRIVVSSEIPDGWSSVRAWGILDVLHANLVQDAMDAMKPEGD